MKLGLRIFLLLFLSFCVANICVAQESPGQVVEEDMGTDEFQTFGPGIDDDEEPIKEYGTFEKGPETQQPGTLSGVVSDEIYLIVSGDNLWDICQQFLGNPYEWPKLWSFNQYITNPHYIYPGDRIVFQPGTETTVPKMEVAKDTPAVEDEELPIEEEQPVKKKEKKTVAKRSEPKEIKLMLKNLSFITKKELDAAGTITHSGEAKKILAAGDSVYLKFKKNQNVKVGDKFVVFDKIDKVRHPKGGKFLGYQIYRKATIEILSIHDNVIAALITDAEMPVERTDKVIPYSNPYIRLVPKEANKEMKGYIVGSEPEHHIIGTNEFAFVDLGEQKGLKSGDILYVVRRGDGLDNSQDRNLPYVIVGRLLVVKVKDRTSTVWVMDSNKELEIGDTVKTKI